MKERIALSEGTEEFSKAKSDWDRRSSEVTLNSLPEFLADLTEGYQHDYGTICHAIVAAAIASANAVDRSPVGGITGFQAGAVMWGFVRAWNFTSNKIGLKMLDYDNFMYPQYADQFDKTITSDIWQSMQKQAATLIAEADEEHAAYLKKLAQYNLDIINFAEKYQDYHSNKDHYERLSIGNCGQWEKERLKQESGFEFAPSEPCEGVSREGRVYLHWKAIVGGWVPFGYRVED